jgi:glucan phosphoethanolaminetransferase (alkaline phosphatase superfamily)
LGSDLLSFKDVASTANYTLAAVPNLIILPTKSGNATLVQTFREAGYKTAWLSNQESWNYGEQADVLDFANSSFDFHLRKDSALLPSFQSFVRQAGAKQFIVLHMDGSHYPYDERCDADSRIFTPVLDSVSTVTTLQGPQLAQKAAAINSYDNTIIEMDRFLSRVISILASETSPVVMLYTSDHGENLFDDERQLFCHAQSVPTHYDAHVPLLVWTNSAYQQAFPAVVAALRTNEPKKISHTSVFPTMLELGRVEWEGQTLANSFASTKFTEEIRKIHGGDGIAREYDSLK